MRKKAIVIGAGLGGLSAALTLSTEFDVTIIERNGHVGGKMQEIEVDGFHFDYGPNTLTMPRFFWEVIKPFGEAKALLPFQKIAEPTCHQLGERQVVFTTDVEKMQQQLALIDKVSASNYPAFLKEISRLYHLSETHFLQKTFFNRTDFFDYGLLRSLTTMHLTKSLHAFLRTFFPDVQVCQLFARFATYIGSSPYATPATFALIAYFELVEGTYYIPGGATKIARVFEQLLISVQYDASKLYAS